LLYIIILKYIDHKFIVTNEDDSKLAKLYGFLVFILQISFLVYFYFSGTRGAGSTYSDHSIFSIIFALIEPDLCFMIYFMGFNDRYYRKFNLIIFIISNIIRGWTGFFMMIFYTVMYKIFIKGGFKFTFILIFVLAIIIIVILFPYIYIFKLYLRDLLSNSYDLSNIVTAFYSTINGINQLHLDDIYLDYFLIPLIGRFQLISSSFGILNYIDDLNIAIDQGFVFPFWLEGLHGVILDRLTSPYASDTLPQELGRLISNNQPELVGWTPNPSLLGLLFVSKFNILFFIIYIYLNILLSIKISNKISSSIFFQNMLWFSTLVFLIPGWLMVYNKFLFCLFFMLLIKYFYEKKINSKFTTNPRK
jgi:hypothetical protein